MNGTQLRRDDHQRRRTRSENRASSILTSTWMLAPLTLRFALVLWALDVRRSISRSIEVKRRSYASRRSSRVFAPLLIVAQIITLGCTAEDLGWTRPDPAELHWDEQTQTRSPSRLRVSERVDRENPGPEPWLRMNADHEYEGFTAYFYRDGKRVVLAIPEWFAQSDVVAANIVRMTESVLASHVADDACFGVSYATEILVRFIEAKYSAACRQEHLNASAVVDSHALDDPTIVDDSQLIYYEWWNVRAEMVVEEAVDDYGIVRRIQDLDGAFVICGPGPDVPSCDAGPAWVD